MVQVNAFLEKIKEKPIQTGLIVLGGILLIILLATWNNVVNEGNKQQADLSAQYVKNQNSLSICITKINETANVTKAQSEAFTAAMVDTVKGRYQQPGSSAVPDQGKLFSAIIENYPELSGLNDAFARVYTVIVGCRDNYRGDQDHLLDMLRKFDAWRTGSLTVKTLGGNFPTDNLIARVGDQKYTGQTAKDKMYAIVLAADALKSYQTGELEALDPLNQ